MSVERDELERMGANTNPDSDVDLDSSTELSSSDDRNANNKRNQISLGMYRVPTFLHIGMVLISQLKDVHKLHRHSHYRQFTKTNQI